ncbi:uncharacterized protein TNCV_914031 [Trichonephila clavipes]|nr:uncharacterized protein TNCV_914031 [Trichonephila clavipes]
MTVGQRSYPSSALVSTQPNAKRQDRRQPFLILLESYALQMKLLMISESSSRIIILCQREKSSLKSKFSTQIREVVEGQQDSRKFYADKKRKAAPTYQPGEHVFVASHPLSNAAQGRSAKLMPRRDGPYVILTQISPSCYEIASLDNPGEPLGVYHTSALIPCNNDKVKPLIPLRKCGRPSKVPQTPGSLSGRRRNQRGRM